MTITPLRPWRGGPDAVQEETAATTLGMVMQFDDADTPADVLDAMLLMRFADGTRPFARTKRLDRVRADATLVPAGVTPTRIAISGAHEVRLAEGDDWLLCGARWPSGGGVVTVVATSDELACAVLDQATRGAEPAPEPEDTRVEIGFWHLSNHGPRRQPRMITAPEWSEIRGNYSGPAGAAFERLVALTGEDVRGRMLLVHGAAGTGKTTALRALAREWRDWCQVDFVLDPERLFGEPGYLIEVAMGAAFEDATSWRLLLLEDCDELIRPGAKESSGQALSRLLNLTDGLLGQGRQVLVAITTNEDIRRLHPAVTRPGRCLARIEVGPLAYAEAVGWLGTSAGVPAGGATLAQLIALRDGTEPVSTPEPEPIGGLYL